MIVPVFILISTLLWVFLILLLYKRNRVEFNKAICEQASRCYEIEENRKKDLARIYAKIDINEECDKANVRALDGKISAIQLKANEIEDKVAKIDSVMASITLCVKSSKDVKRTDDFRKQCVEYTKTCGLSKKDAAEELGIPYSTLRRWMSKE